MQYATIHIQANPFVSLFGFRASKTVTSPRSSTTDMRASPRKPCPSPLSPSATLSAIPLASRRLSPLPLRYGVLVEEKRNQKVEEGREGGGGDTALFSDFGSSRWSRTTGGHVRARTANRGKDRWIRATIGIVDFVIRGILRRTRDRELGGRGEGRGTFEGTRNERRRRSWIAAATRWIETVPSY